MADGSLEQQIMEQVHRLSREQQEQVLDYIHRLSQPTMTWKEWLRLADESRAELQAKYGDGHFFGVQEMLDEIREEASWPRW